MQAKAVIRPATRRDVPTIVRLWEELMDLHRARDPFFTRARNGSSLFRRFVEDNIRSDTACVLVAAVEDRVVGYCQAMLDRHPPAIAEPSYGQIVDFMVTTPYRRSGIGRQMFAALRKWFHTEGIRRIEVRHSTFNEVAARFWPEMGFQPYLQTLFMELQEPC